MFNACGGEKSGTTHSKFQTAINSPFHVALFYYVKTNKNVLKLYFDGIKPNEKFGLVLISIC